MDVIDVERPDGVVVTLGGQTPLKLARMLEESGVNIMGTKPDAIDFAEDRERFAALLDKLGIMYPPAVRPPRLRRPRPLPHTLATRCWCVRATCWAAAA